MNEIVGRAPENIFDTWGLYRKVVNSNHMFHKEIYADIAETLQPSPRNFTLLDLGSGDAAHLAPVLAQLPIGSYCGVDLSLTALGFAEQNLSMLACPVELQHGDLLQVLKGKKGRYDVVFTSFALHHLDARQKADFFKAAHAHLNTGGFLLMVDTVREEHEDLPGYLEAYCTWVHKWQGIDNEEQGLVCRHILDNDFPETFSTLKVFSQQAGFASCQAISRYKWHSVLRFGR